MIATPHDEVLRLRELADRADDDALRAASAEFVGGAERRACIVVTTKTGLPANCFYTVEEVEVLGTEVDGGAAIETGTGNRFLAYNLGDKVPPPNAKVTCTHVPHRWTFTYGKPAAIPLTNAPTTPPTGGTVNT